MLLTTTLLQAGQICSTRRSGERLAREGRLCSPRAGRTEGGRLRSTGADPSPIERPRGSVVGRPGADGIRRGALLSSTMPWRALASCWIRAARSSVPRRDGTRSRQQDRVRSRHQRRSSSCITSSRRSAAGSGCSTPPNRSGAVAPSANSLARGARGRQAADANPTVHRQDRYLVGWCPQAPVFRVSSSTADGFVKVLMRRIVHVNEVSSRHTVEVVSDPNAEGYAGRSRCRHATSASGVRKPGRRLPSR